MKLFRRMADDGMTIVCVTHTVDCKTLGLAAAQSLLVGVLLTLVFGTVGTTGPKPYYPLFFLGISCLWYGCNNAAKEIVKERPFIDWSGM
jgi:hypothetical protein